MSLMSGSDDLMWERVDLNGSANDDNPDGATHSVTDGGDGSWWGDLRGTVGDFLNYQLERDRIRSGAPSHSYLSGRDADYQPRAVAGGSSNQLVMMVLLVVAAVVVVKLVKD